MTYDTFPPQVGDVWKYVEDHDGSEHLWQIVQQRDFVFLGVTLKTPSEAPKTLGLGISHEESMNFGEWFLIERENW